MTLAVWALGTCLSLTGATVDPFAIVRVEGIHGQHYGVAHWRGGYYLRVLGADEPSVEWVHAAFHRVPCPITTVLNREITVAPFAPVGLTDSDEAAELIVDEAMR